jgi:hypothetical protein
MGAILGFEYEPFYADLVRRAFYGDAPGGPVPAGIILANDRIEWAVLRREVPWSLAATAPATAGFVSTLQFTTGPPIDTIAVIERLFVVSLVAFGVQMGSVIATSASVRAVSRDWRTQGLVTFLGTNVAAGASPIPVPYGPTPAQGEEIPIRPFVIGTLPSGALTALLVSNNTVNTALTVIAYGYQRRLRPEELRLDT